MTGINKRENLLGFLKYNNLKKLFSKRLIPKNLMDSTGQWERAKNKNELF